MALVATYGDTDNFNIKIYDMAGGGYYAALCDGATQIFQRRNSAAGEDTKLVFGANTSWVLDRFTAYSYNSVTKILTLSGAIDTYQGIIFTRTEKYQFVSATIIKNTWSISADKTGGAVNFTNWNYYGTINAVWDIDNTNFTNETSVNALGLGVQLVSNGSVYGCIADNGVSNQNNNSKRNLATISGIAVNWIDPSDAAFSLTASTNYTLSITQYFFKSNGTLRDFILQAQLAVATDKGYTGTTWEKICQVTPYLNIYYLNNLTDIKLIPSFQYLNNMWFRDSFWQSFQVPAVYEQKAITFFESKQLVSGQIPTQVNGDGSPTSTQDESTLLYVIRAYYDKIVRGLLINDTSVTNAMSYIGTHVINGQYQCDNTDGGEFKMWMDHFVFSNGSVSGFNQGLYCVALKCAKALRQSISSQQITDAITQYQALYDTTNKLVRFASDKTHSGGDVLAGEALSLFLFGEKMLSKEAVHGTINAIRTSKTVGGGKVVFTNTGGYIPSTDFGVGHQYVQGDYQNGGSWFLYEYLAYYAGFFHGYPAARALITERINIELGSEPTSHEWLQTKSSLANYLSEPASHHVFCWNCAAYTMRITTRQNV